MTLDEIKQFFDGQSYKEALALVPTLKTIGYQFEVVTTGTTVILYPPDKDIPMLFIFKDTYLGRATSYPVLSEGKLFLPPR